MLNHAEKGWVRVSEARVHEKTVVYLYYGEQNVPVSNFSKLSLGLISRVTMMPASQPEINLSECAISYPDDSRKLRDFTFMSHERPTPTLTAHSESIFSALQPHHFIPNERTANSIK
ncbi:uncharacterized protein MYCFIDRAFT_180008 [Pseudocercospora fijiensis CIRAD86]|uniref:Uncharacterized protein n=1 Tax=Pseudocercospora fijiensis (strain CIRAD86) TaxID=383855 RepID=M2ZZ63_PSEFD|nr:uncharacterized protein MYCFIDRAFT_180008 [Pseudocercospora fijiensis CIRAD86]EME77446.1 hypothetical protein MYCFIDRAFT_180008 [Pseudocercospora fijiensis CIRAD86]